MPQFDFQAVFWPQVVWLAVFFAILYFGIVGPTLPKLGKVIGERENKVASDINAAASAKAGADELARAYEASVISAQDAARAQLATARTEANLHMEETLRAANERLDAESATAQRSLEQARTAALVEIQGVASEAASAIVERLTGSRPTEGDAAAAARAALV